MNAIFLFMKSLWLIICSLLIDPGSITIDRLLQQKSKAVNLVQESAFLDVLDTENFHYMKEQKKWFFDAVEWIDPGTYSLTLKQIHRRNEAQMIALVTQSYQHKGKMFKATFPVLFRRTKEGWRDSDLAFFVVSSKNLDVKFTHPSLRPVAQDVVGIVENTQKRLGSFFAWRPKSIEVKLYHDPEWFRQSVKLSLPTWAGGWHEADESIKLWVNASTLPFIRDGLQHELTHQMISDLSNDNAAYWLQEGAAMYFERLLSGHKIQPPAKMHYSFAELCNLQLEELDEHQAGNYYEDCLYVFDRLVKRYGFQKLGQVFSELKKFSYLDQVSSEKQAITNRRTLQAMEKVLGIWRGNFDKAEFSLGQ
jgi:hypothetical protein